MSHDYAAEIERGVALCTQLVTLGDEPATRLPVIEVSSLDELLIGGDDHRYFFPVVQATSCAYASNGAATTRQ